MSNHATHLSTLSFSFTRSFDNWATHQFYQFLRILCHFICHMYCSSCHLFCFLKITCFNSDFFLLLSMLLQFLSSFQFFCFKERWFTVKDPYWLDSCLLKLDCSIEKPNQMTRQKTFWIRQFMETWHSFPLECLSRN